MSAGSARVQTGLEVLNSEGLPLLAGRRVGLVANHTAVNAEFRGAVDLLRSAGSFQLAALFGPEHGVRGELQAGEPVGEAIDSRTGLPAHSLFGETERPTPDMLRGLDALVFDIQDFGVRYATYATTMAYCQEAAAGVGIPFVVLDRPNPLGGIRLEGNLLDPEFASLVGVHPIPIRHGLTAGELSRLFAADRGWPEPAVVRMRGWHRELWYDETGLPWVPPSPNLPTLETLTLYPGTCLVEGTDVSEGRGTTRPFELIGAPWVDAFALADELAGRGIPGVAFRPTCFAPTFSKHAGVTCRGVQAHVNDRQALRPVELGLHLLHALRLLSPGEFAWREDPPGRFYVDLLLGSDRPRRALDAGASVPDVMAGWAADVEAFARRREAVLLY